MERRVELFAAIRFDWQRYRMPVRALARDLGDASAATAMSV